MTGVRAAVTDADLDTWRRIRLALLPDERVPRVGELRQRVPGRPLVLAETGGEVVGSGVAERSSHPGLAFVAPRVLLGARRRGAGTALLHRLVEHGFTLGAEGLRG